MVRVNLFEVLEYGGLPGSRASNYETSVVRARLQDLKVARLEEGFFEEIVGFNASPPKVNWLRSRVRFWAI